MSERPSDPASALPLTPDARLTQRTAPGDSAVVERHRDAVWGIQGAEHFDVQEAIASGGQGTVFRARHRQTGEIVALKVFHQSGIDSQRALKDEFRSLATLQHPSIVRMYELHVADDYAFFTMEFVEGSDLDAYLRSVLPTREIESRGPQYWSALRLAITQLAVAIEAAHNAGLLHLDIKPGNVRVTDTGRVVLLDFGLVRHARQRAGMPMRAGGTPPYMAPEQLGGGSVSEKTDWYAFGAVLTQLLSGARPAGRPPHKHASIPAPSKRPEPPSDLVSLSNALFQFRPDVRPNGREVLARLGALTPRSSVNANGAERLVGRAAELAVLDELFAAYHEQGRGTTVVKVSGRPGVGKTHLLRSFVERLAREQQAHVFAGRCFERAMVPYRLLDELMDRLAEAARRQHVAAASDADVQALARMFSVFASERAPAAEAASAAARLEEITPRAVRALVQILRGLAADARPLVLWLDDVQWTDLDSVPLLMAVLAHNTTPLVLLLSGHEFAPSRPLERALDELVQTQQQLRVVNMELRGLSAWEASALIAQLDPTQLPVKDQIWEQAQGNPLQIAELVRHGSVDELPSISAGDAPSVPLEQLYIGRVAQLSASSRKLLELLALSERPLPRGLLLTAAAMHNEDLASLSELVRGAFISSGESAIDLAHDSIRKCVRGYLSREQCRSAHRALAAAHFAHDPSAHEVLAYHYEGAGEIEACVQHLRQGAEGSAAALAFDRAASLYERAARLNVEVDSSRSLDLRAIELRLLAGHFEEAEPALRQLLSELSLPTFRSEQAALIRCLFELGLMAVRGVPEHTQPRVLSELARMRLTACQAALRGYSASATFRGAVYGVILLRLANEAGEGWRIALASVHVATVLTFSNLAWAKAYGRKLLARAKQLAQSDAELTALVETARGTEELFAGHWRAAYAKLSPNSMGPGFATRFGPEWILGGQMSLIALDHLGEMAQLKLDAQRILESGVQQGNRMIASESRLWCALADLAADRVEDARRQLALAEQVAPKNMFLFVHWTMLRLRVQVLLYEGDYRQALLTIRRERAALRSSGLLTIQFIRVLISQLEAVAIAGEAVGRRSARGGNKRARARLNTLARQLARDTAPHARAAHAVIGACAEAVRGRTPHVLRELQRAEGLYAEADMAVHAAAMRLCRHCILEETEDVWSEAQLMQSAGVHAPRRWLRWLAPSSVRS